MRYTVVLIPEEGGTGRYVAYVPAIPGCVTYGNSIEHALSMAQDAALVTIEGMLEDGDEVLAEPDGAIIASIAVEVPALTPVGTEATLPQRPSSLSDAPSRTGSRL